MVDWGRPEFMRNMLCGDNLGLVLSKRVEGNKNWQHVFITSELITHHSVSMKEVNLLFPLYLYSNDPQHNLFSSAKEPNLKPDLVEKLFQIYSYNPEPEELLAYIYGVFYSNLYRQKYAEALRIDFPRVPFTSNPAIFKSMASLGQRLIELHLLKGDELNPPIARYQGNGENNTIEKVAYDAASERIYINTDKYFEGILPEVWQYQIGGYQVLNKYLKDRKGLHMDDPVRYVRIVTSLSKTIEIQKDIDILYPEIEKMLIDFS
jgi:predicted helicase